MELVVGMKGNIGDIPGKRSRDIIILCLIFFQASQREIKKRKVQSQPMLDFFPDVCIIGVGREGLEITFLIQDSLNGISRR